MANKNVVIKEVITLPVVKTNEEIEFTHLLVEVQTTENENEYEMTVCKLNEVESTVRALQVRS